MRIIKPPKKYDMQEYRKEAAYAQCKVCPFCGQKMYANAYNQKISLGKILACERLRENWLGKRFMWYEAECLTCGAEWASDEFRYDR